MLVLQFSRCVESLGEDEAARLAEETKQACARLGADRETVPFPTRSFHAHRQTILDWLIRIRASRNPDLVLAPSSTDRHQDHAVVHAEAKRAFRGVTVLGYDAPWCSSSFTPHVYITLTRVQLATKIAALACYETQQHRRYMDPIHTEGLARVRGAASGNDFAEAFEAIQVVS